MCMRWSRAFRECALAVMAIAMEDEGVQIGHDCSSRSWFHAAQAKKDACARSHMGDRITRSGVYDFSSFGGGFMAKIRVHTAQYCRATVALWMQRAVTNTLLPTHHCTAVYRDKVSVRFILVTRLGDKAMCCWAVRGRSALAISAYKTAWKWSVALSDQPIFEQPFDKRSIFSPRRFLSVSCPGWRRLPCATCSQGARHRHFHIHPGSNRQYMACSTRPTQKTWACRCLPCCRRRTACLTHIGSDSDRIESFSMVELMQRMTRALLRLSHF